MTAVDRNSITHVGFMDQCNSEWGDQVYLPLHQGPFMLAQLILKPDISWWKIVLIGTAAVICVTCIASGLVCLCCYQQHQKNCQPSWSQTTSMSQTITVPAQFSDGLG